MSFLSGRNLAGNAFHSSSTIRSMWTFAINLCFPSLRAVQIDLLCPLSLCLATNSSRKPAICYMELIQVYKIKTKLQLEGTGVVVCTYAISDNAGPVLHNNKGAQRE